MISEPFPPLNPSSSENFSAWLARLANWLSYRDYSEIEMRERLTRANLPNSLVTALVSRAIELGWLADERVAASAVTRKASQWGKRRLIYHLKERGVNEAIIIDAVSGINEETELSSAYALWLKKFHGNLPQTPQDLQKQTRFLASRGFSLTIVRKVLNHAKALKEENN
ncbi:MAG: RecX family transcriptional regulator [Pseudomonadota bacterium]